MDCKHRVSQVCNSRKMELYVWRRRKCHKCGETFTTVELTVPSLRPREPALNGLKRYWLKEELEKIMEKIT